MTRALRWPAERPLRSVFMGTPAFAVPSLEVLAAATDLVGVVSQPDKPQGRGLAALPSPVARSALSRGVTLVRPAKLATPDVIAEIVAWRPDVIVVAAYGKLLPRAVLDLPTLGCLNVHASLLPRHRGAAPIAAAILAGDEQTGITIMSMNEKMDEGDILLQRALLVAPDDTTATLTARLAALGGATLVEALAMLRGRGLDAVSQDPALATYTPRLTKEDGRIHWREPAAIIERKVRAFTPWPSAFAALRGRSVKILSAHAVGDATPHGMPGTVLAVGEAIRIATGAGALDLLSLQMEGRRPLAARAFAAGARLVVGARFDD